MTSLVSASKLALAEPRQQARKDGSKGHPGFQDAVRASGAERHGSPAVRAPATPSSPSPMQGLAQRLDAFEKVAGLAAETSAGGVSDVPQRAGEQAHAQITEAADQSSPAPSRGQAQQLNTFAKSENLADHTPTGDAAESPQRTVEQTKAPVAQAVAGRSPFGEAGSVTNARAGYGTTGAGDAKPKLAQTFEEDAGVQAEQVTDPDVSFDANAPLANDRIGRAEVDETGKADAHRTPPSPAHVDEKAGPAPMAGMRSAPVELDTEAAEASDTIDTLEPASEPESPDTAVAKTDTMSKQPEAAATWLPLQDTRPAAPKQKPTDDMPAETVAKAASDAKTIPASRAPRDDATASDALRSAPADAGAASVKPAATVTDAQARQPQPAADVAIGLTSKQAQAVASGDDGIERRRVSRPAPGTASDQAEVSMSAAAQAQSAPNGSGNASGERMVSERATSARATSTAAKPASTATTPAPASRPARAADAAVHPGSPSAPANERFQSGTEPAEKEPVRSDSGDDAKPAVSGDVRQADTVRPAPAAVTAVSVQTQPTAPAAPAAAVIATVRADASWAAYFRDTQPGTGAQVNSLKIQLNPLELGNVTAHLQIKDDAVSVELTAETADAQRQLATDADTIAKSLRALGIDVDRVTVQLTARADAQPQTDASGQPRQQGFAADGGAGNAREQDGGSRREQQRQSGDPAASASGPSAASSNRSSSARYI
ncbi:flagellar hook-length control protein FliK [Mesorhizobium australicum]|uniref:Hook-length control protein FliK n=1 Tax=Mesorhizobium australicum TaxID=536018 RepID=A0A1X7PKT0_9HYPH|nr:flagellar hook-length control protein FliK [Mesorhizobium australicum]SMH52103.1 hook-length control protein FliK [Mesorhizobium australicum]